MSHEPFPPVPLQPRHDGWTPDRQWAFIEALADTACVARAARAVCMSEKSAQRLRRHPEAAAFRAAWDAALGQAFGRVEQVALARVINGEEEVIEADGRTVIRRRPCSDRLLIHMLKAQERAREAAAAKRERAHARAVAAAQVERALAANARLPRGATRPPLPPLPVRPDAAAGDTEALAALRAQAPALADSQRLAPPPYPEREGQWFPRVPDAGAGDTVIERAAAGSDGGAGHGGGGDGGDGDGSIAAALRALASEPPIRWQDYPMTEADRRRQAAAAGAAAPPMTGRAAAGRKRGKSAW